MKIVSLRSLFFYLLFFALQQNALASPDTGNDLFNDMLIVDYWNRRINDRMPVTYNYLLQGGYFNMPSARMGQDGELGAGYSLVPPYRSYNLRCQLMDRLEVSGNYRIFKGIKDPAFGRMGFGDFAEKGANLKLCLLHPEDSQYRLPGIAIGLEDFIGTRGFHSKYIVLTQVVLDRNLEMTLGYGADRIRGFFGGISWMPFRQSRFDLLQQLTLSAEYDATPYKDVEIEKHPKGRQKKSPINFGLKYRLWDFFDFSLSYVRGHTLAGSVSASYNLGTTKGIIAKVNNTLPYKAPVNTEPLGVLRPEDMLAQDLVYAMQNQGLELMKAELSFDECNDLLLTLHVINTKYRLEREVRNRLNHLLANLIPTNIDRVIVVMEWEGLPVQEYHYEMEYVWKYANREIGPFELEVLSPMREVSPSRAPALGQRTIFEKRMDLWNMEIFPKTLSFFGNSRGKFKYGLGVSVGINGFLPQNYYYSIRLGYILWNNLGHQTGIDKLNPSKLPNVRTDIIRYLEREGVTVDEAYLQKNWNLGRGWYTRLSGGYFEEEYGGIANEFLYYPVGSMWALGIEGAYLKKRTYGGRLGFTDKVRQLHGDKPFYRNFQPSQYFLNLYYEWQQAKIDFKLSAGKFLANDFGGRFELARYFPSGMKISIWYTLTNGHDKINGSIYHDKGFCISLPFDIFYTSSERSRWSYGMSAWLRDVGVIAETGEHLYDMIREQRLNY